MGCTQKTSCHRVHSENCEQHWQPVSRKRRHWSRCLFRVPTRHTVSYPQPPPTIIKLLKNEDGSNVFLRNTWYPHIRHKNLTSSRKDWNEAEKRDIQLTARLIRLAKPLHVSNILKLLRAWNPSPQSYNAVSIGNIFQSFETAFVFIFKIYATSTLGLCDTWRRWQLLSPKVL